MASVAPGLAGAPLLGGLIAAAFGSQTLAQEVVNPLAVGGWLGGVLDRSVNLGFVGLFMATALSALACCCGSGALGTWTASS